MPRYFWAQLAPLSHLGDFALGILYPLLLLFTFRYLLGPARRSFRILTPALIAVALVVHTREVLQLLVFLVSAAVFARCRGDRESWRRLAVLAAVVVAMGLAYQRAHAAVAREAVTFEEANRLAFQARFHELLQKPPLDAMRNVNPAQYRLLTRGPFLLALVAIPCLWLIRRPWAAFAAPGLLVMALVTRIPYLTFPFILLTYAEMMQTPPRYFVHWGYLFLGAGIGAVVLALSRLHEGLARQRADRRSRVALGAAALIAAVATGEVLYLALVALERLGLRHPDWLYVLAVMGSIPGIVWVLWRRPPMAEPPSPAAASRGWLPLAISIAVVAPLAQYGHTPTLSEQYVEWSRQPSLRDFWEWYNASPFADKVPGSIVRFLREEVPAGRMLAAPIRFAYLLPVLTNHYIPAWGYVLGTDVDVTVPYEAVKGVHRTFSTDPVRSYLERTEYARQVLELDPIFSPNESARDRLAYLREYGVEYVVSGPLQAPRCREMLAVQPGVLEELFSRRGYTVYRVRRDRLPSAYAAGAH
jgi:hypothetical protein